MSDLVPIRIAHSPDSDDAFMFYALTQGLLDTEGLEISHVLADIETLNQAAFEGTYEITALSIHGYAYLADRYVLMPSGASFGDGYGPVVVSRAPASREDLAGVAVAIPGELTTAHLALKLWQPEAGTAVVPFDRILDAVGAGEVAAGVVIHEGQLTFRDAGLESVVDLGAWWREETGGPLPLGGNGLRKDLAPALQRRLCRLLRQSIDYALDHRAEALGFALRYARGLEDDPERSDRFVDMYVNEWTRDYGAAGRRAVQELLDRGSAAGILKHRQIAEFADYG
ncbi:MAG: ABC transporter substrate-binding protein [Acidobacteriota bacterium]|nr:ABC transporter substrate-binding protein [Acidobacteriota bacterium]MDH3523822.1 ABC transporter substrate-binding protein [Acidobacteriota bacterium]